MQVSAMTAYNNYKLKEANKWGESPKIQAKAQATVDRVVTDRLKDRITSMAQEDAKQGDYMDQEFKQMRLSYMHQYVSPDISQPLAQASSWIAEATTEKSPELELLDSLLGIDSGDDHATREIRNAEIYSSDGELIASYNPLGGGWTIRQTTAEKKFLSETTALYAQAYHEAKAELNAAQAASSDGAVVSVLA